MNIEDRVREVLKIYPHAQGNNTEIAICFWEYVAKARQTNHNDWGAMKQIIRKYPIESITRARRKVVQSTKEQRAKEQEYHADYSPRNHC